MEERPDYLSRCCWGTAALLVGSQACAELTGAVGVPVLEPRTPHEVMALILLALVVSAAFVAYVRRGS